MKKLWPVLLISAAALVAGCKGRDQVQAAPVETVRAQVVQSRQRQVPVTLRATGTVHARETAMVSAQVMGRIEQVLVREGDVVRPGQTLVVLDGAALKAAAAQAQAGALAAQSEEAAAQSNASLAAGTLARYKQLEVQKSVSPQEMDEVSRRAEGAEAQLQAAHAQVEAARQQSGAARTMLGYTRVAAPFAGIVTARMADPGTMAAPGAPLLQVDRTGALQLQASVDESSIGALRAGMKLPITVGDGSQTFDGTVAQIVPAADAASHSFLVKIDLPPLKTLLPGMFGSAQLTDGMRQAIVVPRSALVQRGSLEIAYVVDDRGIAQLRYVTLGDQHGDLVEVLSGIAAGELLVNAPEERDFAGKRIEVEP